VAQTVDLPAIPQPVGPGRKALDGLKWLLAPGVVWWQGPAIRRYLARAQVPRLQVGCGPHRHSGWLNCDRLISRGVIYLDATRPLPFPDASFEFVFCEHFLTVLTLPRAFDFLRECHRILRPGGVLRLAQTGLEWLEQLLRQPDPAYVEWACQRLPGAPGPSSCLAFNNLIYGFDFKFVYNRPFLTELLNRAGFSQILSEQVGQSRHTWLQGLEAHGKVIPEQFNQLETMVLEATR
jgi:predicted SAM-dependent methyltransferase